MRRSSGSAWRAEAGFEARAALLMKLGVAVVAAPRR
jgi:hypothetical protein